MLICFEGADGCGKDTIANVVADRLGANRLNFPNDQGVTGPMIRGYLRKQWQVSKTVHRIEGVEGDMKLATDEPLLSAMAFQALQVANRMEVMPKLIEARDGSTDLVLARYWQSGWVYGQLDGLPPSFLLQLHKGMAHPQVNFLLDLDAVTAMERRQGRDGALVTERYEGKLTFTKQVVQLYRDLWRSNLTAGMGEHYVLDANQPVGAIVEQVLKMLPLHRPIRLTT